GGQCGDLVSPGVPELREAVQQDNQRAGARFDIVQANAVDDGKLVGECAGHGISHHFTPARLSRRPTLRTAVHADDLAAYKASGVGGEEGDHVGDLARPAVTHQRPVLHQLVLFDVVDYQESVGNGAAGRDAVDRDVVRPKLNGQAARVFVNGGLGDGVDR